MGLYANRALIEILSKAGNKLKEKKDRKREAGKGKEKEPSDARPAGLSSKGKY
ncbi:MAG: hypothetical protein NC541_10550 [bacterium]|nr:hypothetical protein [bacterium]